MSQGLTLMSLTKIGSFFRNLFRREDIDEQLDQEVSSYVALLADEKMSTGMSREQALRAAKIELGGSDQVKEHVREVRAGAWAESLLQDLRFGWRMVIHNPGFSALVVLTLALGIGANTAIFSVVYGVLLRPLPYTDPRSLVSVWGARSLAEFVGVRDRNHTLQGVA